MRIKKWFEYISLKAMALVNKLGPTIHNNDLNKYLSGVALLSESIVQCQRIISEAALENYSIDIKKRVEYSLDVSVPNLGVLLQYLNTIHECTQLHAYSDKYLPAMPSWTEVEANVVLLDDWLVIGNQYIDATEAVSIIHRLLLNISEQLDQQHNDSWREYYTTKPRVVYAELLFVLHQLGQY